ncbi:MAG TPA: four helix bundle protein [Candidatus Moranbacteria bacterium]|nr:four helix bundle protein [Candidatus Moranbacteria bacterium]HBT45942.1 four helix bundle protein [Candidatus Moranbacteria bacterium]
MQDQKTTLIGPHGGYRNLKTFQLAQTIFDLNMFFCNTWIKSWKLKEQMTGAGRSGKQNIVEGSQDSGTSKKIEIKLTGTARGSFEELLQDYEDFLAEKRLELWKKDDPKTLEVRAMRFCGRIDSSDWSDLSDRGFIDNSEKMANLLICLIHQENYLLDRQLQTLERELMENGGFTENLYKKRKEYRGY